MKATCDVYCDCGIGYNWTDIENYFQEIPTKQLVNFLDDGGLGLLASGVKKVYKVTCKCGREFTVALLKMGIDDENAKRKEPLILKISIEEGSGNVN